MNNPVYQLRVELEGIAPLIWRRLVIAGNATFWDLHVAIQDVMGWNDSHLHQFEIPRGRGEAPLLVGIPSGDDEMREAEFRAIPGWEQRIADHISRQSPEIGYTYDFGDDWQHRIVLEENAAADAGNRRARGAFQRSPASASAALGGHCGRQALAAAVLVDTRKNHRNKPLVRGCRNGAKPPNTTMLPGNISAPGPTNEHKVPQIRDFAPPFLCHY